MEAEVEIEIDMSGPIIAVRVDGVELGWVGKAGRVQNDRVEVESRPCWVGLRTPPLSEEGNGVWGKARGSDPDREWDRDWDTRGS